MQFELKDVFQFGLPTVLLAIVLWQGLPFLRDWLGQFLAAVRDGFIKVEEAARRRDERWQEMLAQMHRDSREDRSEDQKLRQETNNQFQAALSRLQH